MIGPNLDEEKNMLRLRAVNRLKLWYQRTM